MNEKISLFHSVAPALYVAGGIFIYYSFTSHSIRGDLSWLYNKISSATTKTAVARRDTTLESAEDVLDFKNAVLESIDKGLSDKFLVDKSEFGRFLSESSQLKTQVTSSGEGILQGLKQVSSTLHKQTSTMISNQGTILENQDASIQTIAELKKEFLDKANLFHPLELVHPDRSQKVLNITSKFSDELAANPELYNQILSARDELLHQSVSPIVLDAVEFMLRHAELIVNHC